MRKIRNLCHLETFFIFLFFFFYFLPLCASFSSQNWISVRFNLQLQTDVVQYGFKAIYTTKFNRFSISAQSIEINHYPCIVIELNVAFYFIFFLLSLAFYSIFKSKIDTLLLCKYYGSFCL